MVSPDSPWLALVLASFASVPAASGGISHPYRPTAYLHKVATHTHPGNRIDIYVEYANRGFKAVACVNYWAWHTLNPIRTEPLDVPGLTIIAGVECVTAAEHFAVNGLPWRGVEDFRPAIRELMGSETGYGEPFSETLAAFRAYAEQRGLTLTMHLAHPAWTRVGHFSLMALRDGDAVEVWNEYTDRGFRNPAAELPARMPSEVLASRALSQGKRLFLRAVDDWSRYQGCLLVYMPDSANDTPAAYMAALAAGNYFASRRFDSTWDALEATPPLVEVTGDQVRVSNLPAPCTVRWFGPGWEGGLDPEPQNGVLQVDQSTTESTYTLNGAERFVRFRVEQGTGQNLNVLWSQPFWNDDAEPVSEPPRVWGRVTEPALLAGGTYLLKTPPLPSRRMVAGLVKVEHPLTLAADVVLKVPVGWTGQALLLSGDRSAVLGSAAGRAILTSEADDTVGTPLSQGGLLPVPGDYSSGLYVTGPAFRDVVIENLETRYARTGLLKTTSADQPLVLAGCSFVSCQRGLWQLSPGLSVQACRFDACNEWAVRLDQPAVKIRNSLFLRSMGIGVDVRTGAAEVQLNNCLFRRVGWGVRLANSAVEVTNNIFSATDVGVHIAAGVAGPLLAMNYNAWDGNTRNVQDDAQCCGGIGSQGIEADPQFVAPELDDYRLRPDSPAIDAGDPNVALEGRFRTDLEGNARISARRVDMGPLEVPFRAGDFDRDGDVDLSDFLYFQSQFTGAPAPAPFTTAADFDADGGVDLSDLVAFQAAFTGPR